MKFFSIHHCVLIFLTLIFTTAPASADECTIWGRLHHPVTLTCKYNCAPRVAKWNDLSTRSVFAQCNETSCSSHKEGYKMSHDQYMKEDLSLTITAADYSKRNRYACECGPKDVSIQHLRIATVFSAVQMRPAEDLLLDLSVPEPVKVFYRSSDSADDELICNVTQSSAQCSSKYTSRTSLHHPQLTLRGVTSSDSGTYTIQNTEYNEDIRVYNVSVTGLSKGMITLIVLLLLLVISGILIYGCVIYMKMKKRKEEVKRIINQIESVNKYTAEGQKEMKMLIVRAEEKINDLEEDYREDRILSARVTLYCSDCRFDLEIYKIFYVIDFMFPDLSTEQQEMQMEVMKQIEQMKQKDIQEMKRRMEEVKRIINQMESVNKYTVEGQEEMKKLIESAEKKIKHLEEDYREDWILSPRVKLYCSVCRSDLEIYKTLYVIDFMYPVLTPKKNEKQMEEMKQMEKMKQEDIQQLKKQLEEVKRIIIQIKSVNKYTAEGQEEMKKLIVRAEEKINDLKNDDRVNEIHSARVKLYCSDCRSDLEIYKILYLIDYLFPDLSTEEQEEQMEVIKQIEQMKQEDIQKMKKRIEEVKRIINQIESVNKYKAVGQEEMKKLIVIAEKKMNDLEEDYRWNWILSARVKLYCSKRTSDLEIYKILYLIDFIYPDLNTEQRKELMKQMEQEDVQQLKRRLAAVREDIKWIKSVKKGEGQKKLKEKIKRAEEKINDLQEDYRENRILSAPVKLYCSDCRSDLEIYKTLYEKIMSTGLFTTEQMKTEEVLMKIGSVVKILQMLRLGESEEEQIRLYQHVESDLKEIRDWCWQQREDLKSEQQQGGEGDSKAMRKMRALIIVYENWCDETQEDLQRYSKKINDDSAALLLPERDPESSPDQVEVLDEGVALMPLK